MSRASMQEKPLWGVLLSSKVGLLFGVTFLCTSFSLASAQSQDVTPPTLTAFSFTLMSIDTSAGSAVVRVHVSATDDLSGVRSVWVVFWPYRTDAADKTSFPHRTGKVRIAASYSSTTSPKVSSRYMARLCSAVWPLRSCSCGLMIPCCVK